MTPLRISLALILFVAAVLLAAGCTTNPQKEHAEHGTPAVSRIFIEHQVTGQPDIDPLEIILPFDSIRMDAKIYNAGEVVEFSVVNESPGSGSCTDHPCSYRIARFVKNESWQVLRTPIVTMQPYFDVPYYEESCQPMHFATNNWLPGRYRIQYRCGIFQEFIVREMPKVEMP